MLGLRNQLLLVKKLSLMRRLRRGRTTSKLIFFALAFPLLHLADLARTLDRSKTDTLTEGIRLLNRLAIQLKAKRMAAGALNLASPEVKIHMESSESTGPVDAPVDVETKELFETNSLVEEFMLLANISVAERIYKQFPQTAVLRYVIILTHRQTGLQTDDEGNCFVQSSRSTSEDEFRGSPRCLAKTKGYDSRRFNFWCSRRFSR